MRLAVLIPLLFVPVLAAGQRLPATASLSLPSSPEAAAERAKQEQIADLMDRALATEDPEERAEVYTKILLLDPANQVAYQGRKDSLEEAAKLREAAGANAAAEREAIAASLAEQKRLQEALREAEAALLREDLDTAKLELAVAREIRPDEPDVQRLAPLVEARLSERRRTRWLFWGGVGAGVLIVAVVLLLRARRKDPFFEVIAGPDRGAKHPFNGELLRIGAVAELDGDRNDLVLGDPNHLISRFHCEIHRRGNRFFVIDLGSSNGTFLNRREVQPGKPVRIKPGSVVNLAGVLQMRLGLERRC